MKLVIAEKPSVAKSIAAVLNSNERKDGFFIGNNYIISWCVGHLVGLATADSYDEKYSKWNYSDLPIIPDKWQYKVASDKTKQIKILSELMKRKDVEAVINACDAGREGELIFRLVYEHNKCKKSIQRLWISSMEEKAIIDGFNNLKSGEDYDNLYNSALCRTRADWIVGINATRLFSVLYGETLNVGRVQSPTLALIVEREQDISNFKKEPFYTPEINCGNFTAIGEKTKDKSIAEAIVAKCNLRNAVATHVSNQEKSISCPKLYDLTTLQREANRMFGYTAQQTLDYLQSLYEKKLTTYPRTDSRYLTDNMENGIKELVQSVFSAVSFLNSMKPTINAKQVINNSKVTDHHAIIPTTTMVKSDLTSLPKGELNILHMVCIRLASAVGEKHIYNETVVTLDCEGSLFEAKGKSISVHGWLLYETVFKSLHKKRNENESNKLPKISEGEVFESVKAVLKEGYTQPPKHFNEDTLLSAMEKAGTEDLTEEAERKGLGTPATRAGIIEKLIKTKFLERKNKDILPTQKGINLITVLPDNIKSPVLTAEWENQLKQIEQGGLSSKDFMNNISLLVKELVENNTMPNEEYEDLFPNFKNKGIPIGKCPRCNHNVIESKKGFFCEDKACKFALWKNNHFFKSKKKELSKDIATALLKDGRFFMSGLYSEKTGKTYSATVLLDDTGGRYVNFKLEFPKK